MLKLGSLFDGIGGWQLAAIHNGVQPVWSSEIDPFPMMITKKHFPETKQLGDITKIDINTLEFVDIVCAGSPCQDLSQAGKQRGLGQRGDEEVTRSGLFRTAIDIVRGMRSRSGGRFPRAFIWENVCGAYNSNSGADFRAVLEEIGESEIPIPAGGKWANAGMVELHDRTIEWRTLDAQFFGVPQRRRRIFLTCLFTPTKPGRREILFERQSMPGNHQESGSTRESASTKTVGGAPTTGADLYNGTITGNTATTVTTKTGRYADASGPSVIEEDYP